MVSVRIEGLSVRYGDGVAPIANLDLEIDNGRIACIVGRNGSGKSTLLRAVVGVQPITAGSIRFLPSVHPTVSWVPQDYRSALYPWWSVQENLFLGFSRRRVAAEALDITKSVLECANIDLRADPFRLSGGQQQIIAVLRALIRPGADLMVLDEPFSALDVEHRSLLRDGLFRLSKAAEATVLFVSHDLLDAVEIGDQIVILRDRQVGRLVDVRGIDPDVEDGRSLMNHVKEIELELSQSEDRYGSRFGLPLQ